MTTLTEWKQTKISSLREQVKARLRAGDEVLEHLHFTNEELEDICEEVSIEDYYVIVEDFEELNLDEAIFEDANGLQEVYEFIPREGGDKMDIEIEIDLDAYRLTEESIESIQRLFFAEEYEVLEIDEGSHSAVIVFKRSEGEVAKRKKCGKGERLVGNRCLPQTGSQKAKERRRGIKLKRALKAKGKGFQKRKQIKKKITQRRVRGRARNLSGTEN